VSNEPSPRRTRTSSARPYARPRHQSCDKACAGIGEEGPRERDRPPAAEFAVVHQAARERPSADCRKGDSGVEYAYEHKLIKETLYPKDAGKLDAYLEFLRYPGACIEDQCLPLANSSNLPREGTGLVKAVVGLADFCLSSEGVIDIVVL